MKKLITLFAIILLATSSIMAQKSLDLLYNQPFFDGGSAVTSTVSLTDGIDYEAADNFTGLANPIEEVVFYGLSMRHNGTQWEEQTPSSTEPFIVRFYEYEEAFVPGLIAPANGTYQIALLDDWGDGWNGGQVCVLVEGVQVLSDLTLDEGAGPEYFEFSANEGDEISTVYTAGSWSAENYYAILDPDQIIIAEDGGSWEDPGESTPTGIAPGGIMPLEPDWSAALETQSVVASVTNIGDIWEGARTLYEFTASLNTAVDLNEGWISIQMDSDNGSGTWFLWLNSIEGDLYSYQNSSSLKKVNPRYFAAASSIISDNKKGVLRELNGYDLAFELWGGVSQDAPDCVNNIYPSDEAADVNININLEWESHPLATGYELFLGEILPGSGIDLGDVTNYEVSLDYSTTYLWKVVPYNEIGSATDCPVFSFTTQNDPTLYPPFTQDFNSTPFPPENWHRHIGLLTEDTELEPISSGWTHHYFGNINDGSYNSAYINIYNTKAHWLITPPVDLGMRTDLRFTFDIALTPYSGTGQTALGPDDYVAVVISTDNGQTWSSQNVLIDWDSEDVILPTGNHISIPLAGYTGKIKIGFYAERPSGSTPDLRFYVDNVTIEEIPQEAVFTVNPTEWDFGNVEPGLVSSPKTFTISNTGTGTLSVEAPTLDNTDDFILYYNSEDFPASLTNGDIVTFWVEFAPQSLGELTGQISIPYNDGTQQTSIVNVYGTGWDRPEGSTCENPFMATLPIIDYVSNTELYGDDYSSSWINPTSSYLNGNDFVIQFDLEEPGLLSGSISGSWTGLIILENCPDPDTPADVLAIASGSSGGSFSEIVFEAGTYLAIVSTYPSPQFTDFTLNLWADPVPECPVPYDLATPDITMESALLSWQQEGDVLSWNILWGTQGFDPEIEGTLIEGVSNPYLLEGLQSASSYTFYVQAVCDPEISEWSDPLTFSTLCEPFMLPFSESFDADQIPICWSQSFEGDLSSDRWTISNTSNAGGEPYEMKASYQNATGTSRLITPPLDLSEYESVILSFNHFLDDYGQGATVKIQSSTDGVNWIDEDYSIDCGSGNIGPETVTVPITNISSSTYIAWVIDGNHYQFDNYYIDNVLIEECVSTFYTLNLTIEGSGNVEVNGVLYTEPVTVEEATQLSLDAMADMGWEFAGWSGDLVSSQEYETIVMDGDKYITATFTEELPEYYTLNIDITGSGNVEVNGVLYTEPVTVEEGTELSLDAMADMGWVFAGWSGDLVSSQEYETIVMDGDKYITATFTEELPEYYTLYIDIIGSGNVEVNGVLYAEPVTVEEGTELSLDAMADMGWVFAGWSGDLVSSQEYETIVMDGDKYITATFTEELPEYYTLYIDITGSGNVEVNGVLYTEPVTVEEDTELSLDAMADIGWEFAGWSGDLVSSQEYETIVMDGDKSITATFTEEVIETYMLTLEVNPEGTGMVEGEGVYQAGDQVPVLANAQPGYMFVSWTLEGEVISLQPGFTYTMPDMDVTLVANFDEIPVGNLIVDMEITPVSCPDYDDGSIFVSVTGGQKPYNICLVYGCNKERIPGKSAQTAYYDGLVAGWWMLHIIDANGEVFQECILVPEPDPLSAIVVIDPITCPEEGYTATATITISGGTMPYTFDGEEIEGNTVVLTDLLSGDYSYEINDANLCGAINVSFEIEIPDPIIAQAVYEPIGCFGQTTLVDVDFSGGTGILSLYNVIDDQMEFVSTLPLEAPIELGAGIYNWIVMDENQCMVDIDLNITEPDQLAAVLVDYSNPLCYQGNEGYAVIEISGGTPPYYSDMGLVEAGIITINGLYAGDYTVNITDSNNCPVMLEFGLFDPEQITIEANTTHIFCHGMPTGIIEVIASGGTGDLVYSLNGDDWQCIPLFVGLYAGWYDIYVKDENGCIAMMEVEIIEPDEFEVELEVSHESSYGANDGEIMGYITGGVPPYSTCLFTLCIENPFNGDFNTTRGQGFLHWGLEPGEYTVAVIDQHGCIWYECVTIDEGEYEDPESTSIDSQIAEGDYFSVAAYPNPFTHQATIEFSVKEPELVTVEVYNLLGEKVSVLFQGNVEANVVQKVVLKGEKLLKGIYLYKISTEDRSIIDRIILAR